MLEGEIKVRFATSLVQQAKFSELLSKVVTSVIEELIAMAKRFKEAMGRGENLGLKRDELPSTTPSPMTKKPSARWGMRY